MSRDGGWQSVNLAALPKFKAELQAQGTGSAARRGVERGSRVYHSDHRELAPTSADWPFKIMTILEVRTAPRMGLPPPTTTSASRSRQDGDAIITDGRGPDEAAQGRSRHARKVLRQRMLGDQPLTLQGKTGQRFAT